MSETLDLDALMPESVTIKYDGQDITLVPPRTRDLLKLGIIGKQLAEPDKLSDAELDELEQRLTNQIGECIPELKGKPLSSTQLLFLMQKIAEMGTPPDSAELKKRGITVDSPKVQ